MWDTYRQLDQYVHVRHHLQNFWWAHKDLYDDDLSQETYACRVHQIVRNRRNASCLGFVWNRHVSVTPQ